MVNIIIKEMETKNNYIVIDIETTSANSSPLYIIQIAYNIYDNNLQLLKMKNFIINENNGKQDYFKKISMERIEKEGKNAADVLNELSQDFDECRYIVGHNVKGFDMRHMSLYFEKYNIPYKYPPTIICTMKTTKYLVMARGVNNQLKETSLGELYKFLFENDLMSEDKSHTADYDIEITYKCLYRLIKENILENHQLSMFYKIREYVALTGDTEMKNNKEMYNRMKYYHTDDIYLCEKVLEIM